MLFLLSWPYLMNACHNEAFIYFIYNSIVWGSLSACGSHPPLFTSHVDYFGFGCSIRYEYIVYRDILMHINKEMMWSILDGQFLVLAKMPRKRPYQNVASKFSIKMCECVCVCAYFALFLYEFRIVVYKYIFATTPHSMDEWIEENPNRSKLCSI